MNKVDYNQLAFISNPCTMLVSGAGLPV